MIAPERSKPTILVLCDSYLPGTNAGGPIRSVNGLVTQLDDRFAFRIVTRDRDVGSPKRYAGLPLQPEWIRIGNTHVLHLPPQALAAGHFRRLLNETDYDLLYLNSVFSAKFSILPLALRWARQLAARPVIVAPRGELGPESLRVRSTRKKRMYLWAGRVFGLFRGAAWQASSHVEAGQIAAAGVGGGGRIYVARNLTPRAYPRDLARSSKSSGVLRAAAVGRVARIKNIQYAVEQLGRVKGNVSLDVFGPMQDPEYWAECEAAAAQYPALKVTYRGVLPSEEVMRHIRQYDLLISPTLNENFGHAIIEALCSGCPVIVSENTPWQNLQAREAGWTVPLHDREAFRAALQHYCDMDEREHARHRIAARSVGQQAADDAAAREAHIEMFLRELQARM